MGCCLLPHSKDQNLTHIERLLAWILCNLAAGYKQPVIQAGWFPTYTLGEDMALALEVQKEGWKGAYVKEYLAIGEVPETIRNAFMQKSRWCKGGMQIFFSRHNALFARNLSLFQRIVWNTSGWSYICTTITTPVFLVRSFGAITAACLTS